MSDETEPTDGEIEMRQWASRLFLTTDDDRITFPYITPTNEGNNS